MTQVGSPGRAFLRCLVNTGKGVVNMGGDSLDGGGESRLKGLENLPVGGERVRLYTCITQHNYLLAGSLYNA